MLIGVPSTVRLRRISPIAVRPGEGLLSDHIAGAQPWRRELVFLPHCGHLKQPEITPRRRCSPCGDPKINQVPTSFQTHHYSWVRNHIADKPLSRG